MTTNPLLKNDIQQLQIDSEYMQLYILDATDIGGSIYRFTNNTIDGVDVVFGGNTFTHLDVSITGLGKHGDLTQTRPVLKVENLNLTFVAFVDAYRDGLNAKVSIITTFRKYIDGQSEGGSSDQLPQDIFYITHKKLQNKFFIEWELGNPMDQPNLLLPRNQALSTCTHEYRIWNGSSFVYSTCPYSAAVYFDSAGNSTVLPADDDCGRRLKDCEARYGTGAQLPTKAFPGINKISEVYKQ